MKLTFPLTLALLIIFNANSLFVFLKQKQKDNWNKNIKFIKKWQYLRIIFILALISKIPTMDITH